MDTLTILCLIVLKYGFAFGQRQQEDFRNQPQDEWPVSTPPSPYILYGPHGYRTYPHSRCQEVPTVNLTQAEMSGPWFLTEHITSFDGKPFPPHTPYLCPESKIIFDITGSRMNASQVSFEWPVVFKDVVEWEQHPVKSGVFFHEENIFSLWTMKVMDFVPDQHLLFFLCIDYTVWPGWNHRGVFILSRTPELKKKVGRKLTNAAHRRLRMDFHRSVNTTTCDPDEFLDKGIVRWHPHKKINRKSYRAPLHPYMSRSHRRNLSVLD